MSEQTIELEKQELETTLPVTPERSRPTYAPRVDIYDTNDGIVLEADMPGVDQDSVDITLEKNTLTIRGHVVQASPDGYNVAHAEYRVGDFLRQFTISDEIDRDEIQASMSDGVLRLTLAKAETAKSRKIVVNTQG